MIKSGRGRHDFEQTNAAAAGQVTAAASKVTAASHFGEIWLLNFQSQLWECVAGGRHSDCSGDLGSFL